MKKGKKIVAGVAIALAITVIDLPADFVGFKLVPTAYAQQVQQVNDDVRVTIDGRQIRFDQPPILVDGRVKVPFRTIFEELGVEVIYVQQTHSIIAFKDDIVITHNIGSDVFNKNNVNYQFDTRSEVVNGRTLVPIRAVSELLGAEVSWNNNTRTVAIISPSQVNRLDFTINYPRGSYAQVLTEIHRDNNNIYYYHDASANDITVQFTNGRSYTLKAALESGLVTIAEVQRAGLNVITQPMETRFTINYPRGNYAQVLTEIHRDNNNIYYYHDASANDITIQFTNGRGYTLKSALSSGLVTIAEVQRAGLNVITEPIIAETRFTINYPRGNYAQVLTEIYRDNNNIYYYRDASANDITVQFTNGRVYTLKSALESRLVTIAEIQGAGLNVITEPILSVDARFTIEYPADGAFAQVLTEIHRDSNNIYYYRDASANSIQLRFNNGRTVSLKESLRTGLVTTDELIRAGFNFMVEPILSQEASFSLIFPLGGSYVQTLTEIYRDSNTIYYYPDNSISDVKIRFRNGRTLSVQEALRTGVVTITELQTAGLYVIPQVIYRIQSSNSDQPKVYQLT